VVFPQALGSRRPCRPGRPSRSLCSGRARWPYRTRGSSSSLRSSNANRPSWSLSAGRPHRTYSSGSPLRTCNAYGSSRPLQSCRSRWPSCTCRASGALGSSRPRRTRRALRTCRSRRASGSRQSCRALSSLDIPGNELVTRWTGGASFDNEADGSVRILHARINRLAHRRCSQAKHRGDEQKYGYRQNFQRLHSNLPGVERDLGRELSECIGAKSRIASIARRCVMKE
jgi:hypothetical protein